MQHSVRLDRASVGHHYLGDDDDWHFFDNFQNRTSMSHLLLQVMNLFEHLEVILRRLPAYHELEKSWAGAWGRGELSQLHRGALPRWADCLAFDAAKPREQRRPLLMCFVMSARRFLSHSARASLNCLKFGANIVVYFC